MFTGIIEEVGTVRKAAETQLEVEAAKVLEGLKEGDSIAINGACLTVTSRKGNTFSVDVVPETLRRTNLGGLGPGDPVNLERALAAGDRMGGHFVQGHVEATAKMVEVVPEREAFLYRFEAPTELMRYIVPKGFVAIDGVSLTVIDCRENTFTVTLIPYTQQNTNLGTKGVGSLVNLETDILGRYIERLLSK